MEGRGRKQLYYIPRADEERLAFAGLWDEWWRPENSLLSCTIVVGRPNELMAEIHDRMVVILPEDAYGAWLSPRTSLDTVRSMMERYPAARMHAWRVSTAVANARNEGADLLRPL
jgi:putative SOS response-associated peptidase YedK